MQIKSYNYNLVKKLYFQMIRLRKIELEISKRYSENKMRCPIHLSIGQESIPVAICNNLNKKDLMLSTHRAHYHYLAKGGNLKSMIAELYGKETGCNLGLGGSMHLKDLSAGLVAAVPIVGSTIPIGVGLAWALKLERSKNIVVVFFGEGSTEEGVFHESLNFASLHDLPILFVCENNMYSVYSHLNKRQHQNRSITKISQANGIQAKKIDSTNVVKINDLTQKIILNIKKKKKPYLLELLTYRHFEHCGPNLDDHLEYRNKKESTYWLKKCPIKFLEKKYFNPSYFDSIENNKNLSKIDREINDAFNYAEMSKFPKRSLINKFIYA